MFYSLSGLDVNNDGEIINESILVSPGRNYHFSIPEALIYTPYAKLSASQKALADQFYQTLAKLTGKTVDYLWKYRHYALPTKGDWTLCLLQALAKYIDINQAGALANWAGGSVLIKTWTGMSYVSGTEDIDQFLFVDDLYGAGLDQTVSIKNALLALKKANPGAHEYVINVVAAKAARRATQEAIQKSQDTKKVIDKELEIAKKIVSIPAQVAEGALDTAVTAAGWVKYTPWIVGGVLVLGAYLLYRNRETVGKVAAARLGL